MLFLVRCNFGFIIEFGLEERSMILFFFFCKNISGKAGVVFVGIRPEFVILIVPREDLSGRVLHIQRIRPTNEFTLKCAVILTGQSDVKECSAVIIESFIYILPFVPNIKKTRTTIDEK